MTTPQQPEKYRPVSFSQYVWERCKSQPLIPIGKCLAIPRGDQLLRRHVNVRRDYG